MPRRQGFRPTLADRLEERVVLSGGLKAATVHTQAVATAQVRVGAMGDSITDEYRTYRPDRSGAKNWVEILSATRQVRFGPYSRASMGEPRNSGYAFNWARDGATSDDMVASQLPGLAGQVRRGQVNLAWMFIGSNDFLSYVKTISPLTPPSVQDVAANLTRIEQRLDNNVTTAVTTILAANPNARVVVGTIPDIRTLPAVAVFEANPLMKPLIDQVQPAIDRFNARVNQLAAANPGRVAVADLAGLYGSVFSQAAASGKFNEGGQAIDVRNPSDDPTHLFLADGVHIGTVGQGLVADQFIRTVDAAFGLSIKPLQAKEILRQAKIR